MKKSFILGVGVLVVIATLFTNASKPIAGGYDVGDDVKDFTLPNIDGKMISMADYSSAKGFIIIFTCNTCPYAKLYESRILDLDKKYTSKGFPVIAINPNDITKQPGDTMEEMQKRSNSKGYSFPYLRDDDQEVTKAFGASKTPHVYVLNKAKDTYRVAYIGAIDNSPNDILGVTKRYVEDAINSLLVNKTPKITKKRAIGCSIKWKN